MRATLEAGRQPRLFGCVNRGLLAVAVLPLAGGLARAQQADPASFARGYGPAMRVAAAVCALGGIVSWIALRGEARPRAPAV